MQRKQQRRSRRPVKQTFEPKRLSSIYLAKAYEQLVPQPGRLIQPVLRERITNPSPRQLHREAQRRIA